MTEINPAVKSEIDTVFAQQKDYALQLRKSDYRQRLEVLQRFETAFRGAQDRIHESAAADFGKPGAEVDMAEIKVIKVNWIPGARVVLKL